MRRRLASGGRHSRVAAVALLLVAGACGAPAPARSGADTAAAAPAPGRVLGRDRSIRRDPRDSSAQLPVVRDSTRRP
ncbi:MAG TPA: hypothetical protein VKA84_09075 [Gemmatimonadaceae bacterium]|nr:hypothetical protein [Gemmatimonadaceae bacterium]